MTRSNLLSFAFAVLLCGHMLWDMVRTDGMDREDTAAAVFSESV